jgi:hypothetical protein
MKCDTNVNSTPPTQLSHTFSYIVAILIHSYFESPNIFTRNLPISWRNLKNDHITVFRIKLPFK